MFKCNQKSNQTGVTGEDALTGNDVFNVKRNQKETAPDDVFKCNQKSN